MKKIFLVLFFALLFSSCNHDEMNISTNKLLKYEEKSLELKKHLNEIALELRANNAKISDQDAIIAAAKSNFGEDSANFSSFLKAFEKSSSEHELELTPFQKESIENIHNSITMHDSFESFKQSLDDKLITFANSDLNIDEKDFILTYIVTYKVTLDFIANNQGLFRPATRILNNGRVEGWWDDWGECVSGIAGGAGFVGLVGFGVGGPWGAGIGAVLGGLGGAADHC